MRTTKRIALLSTTLVAALALAACSGGSGGDSDAGGETHTMKLALNQTEDHPSFIALEAFGEKLAEDTDGRWNIEVYPNSTLGDQNEYLQSVSDGVIDLAIVSAPQLENLQKDFVIFSLPTVFDSIDHQMDALADPEVVGDVYTSLEDSNNITVVGGFTQGARNMYTKDGIAETPADLKGKKIRVQESPVFIAMIEALGGSPTPMAYSEVYTGLQSGVIDGAENNEISYFTQKHFEVAPFFSNTQHLIGADFLIINSGTLDGMSDEDRAAFDAGWEQTWKQHTELWKTQTEEAIAEAKAGGATFGDVDTAAYTEALSPLLDEFITTDSQRTLYDAIRASAE
ncbi:TRAP transporter substrate-binding protein [Microbacterium sp. H1-D42]|uniref:TRAP transporter substrate-binding protein n=1 Tax=Microbacterium sp. H1-D42 TaxID=2925844 RepID=UPI001F52FBDE|nr:TRAP transporter substrate-binding protein [Microbacterium sp. H1-D42]UNK70717.1 TRAP transporter substrate-binding protein [Microbacterium sp. H1-D42]